MKKSRRSKEHSCSLTKDIGLQRSSSFERPLRLHSVTPDKSNVKEKTTPGRGNDMGAMHTIFEKKQKTVVAPKKKKKQKEKKKKEGYEVCLKELKPLNLEKQKLTFFSEEYKYNPYFLYPGVPPGTDHDKQYKGTDKVHDKYLSLAIRILQKANNINYLEKLCTSPILSMDETSLAFDKYIQFLDIDEFVEYDFMENTVAPTSVIHNNNENVSKVVIGLPIQYRKITIMGVLNHEIGTHFIRKYNNRLQKWHKERKKYGLKAYLKHEQGLAAINQLFEIASKQTIIPPMLYPAALHYYSCYQASRMSFSELFHDLAKYQKDPEARWRECVRVKRGIADTNLAQGMYKDQIYLRGAYKILKARSTLNMIDMHCGKLTLKDCMKMAEKKLINYEKTKMPYFLSDLPTYHRALDRIAKENFIDEWSPPA